jgi:hypothetical protein
MKGEKGNTTIYKGKWPNVNILLFRAIINCHEVANRCINRDLLPVPVFTRLDKTWII